MLPATGGETTLPSKVPYRAANSGDRLVAIGPNGGGYGNPFDRDPEAVLSDMLDGYISAEQAHTDYGVVIRGKTLDAVATAALRASAAETK
jgi:N-methylhydantoinase B